LPASGLGPVAVAPLGILKGPDVIATGGLDVVDQRAEQLFLCGGVAPVDGFG